MRIWIFSDLHRRAYARPWTPAAIPDADVAVVAGDVGEGLAETVAWLAAAIRPAMPVVLVPGNHEYYGGTMQSDLAHGRRAAARQGIDLLDNDTVALAGCTLSGCSLWTDYALDGIAGRAAAMDAARARAERPSQDRLVARPPMEALPARGGAGAARRVPALP